MTRISCPSFSRVILIGFFVAMGQLLLGSRPAARAATSKEVDDSVDKAVAYLFSAQKNGTWEAEPGSSASAGPGGITALATYALLSAGIDPQDARIAPALTFLKQCPMTGTYAIGIRCQIWQFLPQPFKKDVEDCINHDLDALTNGGHADPQLKEVPSMFYTYASPTTVTNWDHSNSQYGVLGMWACAELGYEVPTKYWQAVDAGWRAHQFANGGWCYNGGLGGNLNAIDAPPVPPGTPKEGAASRASMTCAGLATLFVTDEWLHGLDGINCGGNIFDRNIEAALGWLGKYYDEVYKREVMYNLYGVSRIGVASGRKYIGTIDWYKSGADYLVKRQNPNGAWGTVINTSFGLLFMVRGRAPVVVNKLQYDLNMHGDTPKVANWNQRPRDAATISRWMGKENERLFNWQIVNLKVPVDELHDAPILYISGNQALDFTDEEMTKLRQYVEEGGLIFANADCSNSIFSRAILKLGHALFPAYEFRDLPINSPIFTNEQFMRNKWSGWPKLEALSNGDRELIVLESAHDPGRFWQTQTYFGHEYLFQFFDDLFLYTVDRGEKGGVANKGESYVVRRDPAIQADKTIKVARLEYPGNWDPEPGGWRRLAAMLHNTEKTDLAVSSVKLGDGKLDNSYKVAHLTGTFRFTLADSFRAEIKKYVEGGGTLILDSCGGDAQCAASLDKEIAAIFRGAKIPDAPLPLESPAYALGPKLDKVTYRSFARKVVGQLHTPRIRGVEINGRLAVFISGEDLSCGMVGTLVDGIYGYQPASATALMEKLVLFANTAKPVASSQPAVAAAAPTAAPATRPAAAPVDHATR